MTGEVPQYSGGSNHMVFAPVAAILGLTSAQLISVTPTEYNAIPRGSDYYPDGIFLENNQTEEVDQISGGQRHWVSAMDMVTIGLTTPQIATIGADQFNAIPLGSNFEPSANTINLSQSRSNNSANS